MEALESTAGENNVEYEAERLKTLREYCVLDTGRDAPFDELALLASRICQTPIALISLVDKDRIYFKSAVGLDAKEVSSSQSFCGQAITRRDITIIKDAREDQRFYNHPLVISDPHIRFYAAAPLLSPNGHAVGTLCVIDHVPRTINLEQQEALRILAHQIITQLELGIRAMRDPLTGLFNRRYADETLQSEFKRMERRALPLGLILLDFDSFKLVNDTHGHEAGDQVLQSFGKLLTASVRSEDVACRFGGEEFMVILPESPLKVTHQRAEEIRNKFERLEVTCNNFTLKQMTVSAGVAGYPVHGITASEVLRAADRALYQAKADGRNMVVVSPN